MNKENLFVYEEDGFCELRYTYGDLTKFESKSKKYDKLESNWNSLREWLDERIEYWENEEKKWVEQGFMKFGGEANNKIILKGLLDKMNELERGDDN